MTQNYITITGVIEKLRYPVTWKGFDSHAFHGRVCGAINHFTNHEWTEHDLSAVDCAEYLAASLYAYMNGHRAQADELRKRALTMFDLLNPKPQWRNGN